MGNQTRDLPARSIVPQPATLPRESHMIGRQWAYNLTCGKVRETQLEMFSNRPSPPLQIKRRKVETHYDTNV
jgi:hypothetical protein